MELRLLGPFEVVDNGAAQPLPSRGERALLTLLALSTPHTVAAGTLIEMLWAEDDLPEDPVNALQTRVSKLRRALTAMGVGDALLRHGSGYRLEVDRLEVDIHRFASLVGTARRSGDPLQAIGFYDEALRLWRGEPLVDF